jgi:hypothetical protein
LVAEVFPVTPNESRAVQARQFGLPGKSGVAGAAAPSLRVPVHTVGDLVFFIREALPSAAKDFVNEVGIVEFVLQ